MNYIKNRVETYRTSQQLAKAVRKGQRILTCEDGSYMIIINSKV